MHNFFHYNLIIPYALLFYMVIVSIEMETKSENIIQNENKIEITFYRYFTFTHIKLISSQLIIQLDELHILKLKKYNYVQLVACHATEPYTKDEGN